MNRPYAVRACSTLSSVNARNSGVISNGIFFCHLFSQLIRIASPYR